MIFDKFCLLAEKHFPELKPLAEDAKLFVFDKPAHKYLRKDAGEEYAKYADIFALPFKITAIEDPASLIIFVDTEDDQIGFSKRRDFIEIMPWDQNEMGFRDEGLYDQDKKKFMEETMGLCKKSACSITAGSIYELILKDKNMRINGEVSAVMLADEKKIHSTIDSRDFSKEQAAMLNQSGLMNAVAGIEELLTIVTAEKFILEEKPVREERQKKKILRSHQRPKYSILTAKEIRGKMDIAHPGLHGDRKGPVPHERRRHYRKLNKDGGYFKEDKIVAVKATWIGQSEKHIGNKFYKVRLDIAM